MFPFLLLALPALALPQATCTSCMGGGDESRGLLYRAAPDDPVVLEWRGAWPDLGRDRIRLYAGNPSRAAALPDRGLVDTTQPALRLELSGEEIGKGTLLTVLVRERPGGAPVEILSWEVWRLLDNETRGAQLRGPAPHEDWELDLTPSVLRALRGGEALPRTEGEGVAWWSLVGQTLDDLDLDGASTGLPGLSVNVSQPWKRGEETWRDKVEGLLDQEQGHRVRYGELEWIELEDRPLTVASNQRIQYYYAVVTLHTNAGVRRYENRELLLGSGIGEGGRFGHETSANLASPEDPRLWSGYSARELSEDPRLLRLLAEQIRDGEPVPDLPTGIGRTDGDGGLPTWQVGFTTRIQSWDKVLREDEKRAVIKAVDVVATRHGLAIPRMHGDEDPGLVGFLERALEGDGPNPLDLGDPPAGWRLASAYADVNTRVGSVQLQRELPPTAQRLGAPIPLSALYQVSQLAGQGALPTGTSAGQAPAATSPPAPPPKDPDALEAQTRFVLSADLRAGALVREPRLAGRERALVPIDAYAQFVVQLAVLLEKDLVVADRVVEVQPGTGGTTSDEGDSKGWIERIAETLDVGPGAVQAGIAGLGVIVALLLLHLTGLGKVLSRVAMLVLPKPKDPKS